MSIDVYRESPGKFDSRTLNRKTLNRWTGRIRMLSAAGERIVWQHHVVRIERMDCRIESADHASAFGCSAMWCFRMWGLNIIVVNPSPIAALGVKSPHVQF